METIKISSRCGDFKEWKNILSTTILKHSTSRGKYETKENAYFVFILMIKKGHRKKKPDISLILHNKLTKLDMEDEL